ncbi:hypothetical protein, partial [Parasutterella excrementihominis]|uniref:hypothetical protein n=1 Tax=Parasutterella excrementihominis TaxID=487175 RepID=UPI003FEF00CF
MEQQKPAKTRTKAVSDSFLKVANLKDIKVNIQDSNPKPNIQAAISNIIGRQNETILPPPRN